MFCDSTKDWAPILLNEADCLTEDALIAVTKGDVPAIVFDNFYPQVDTGRIVARLSTESRFRSYVYKNAVASYLGCAAIEWKHDKAGYIERARSALVDLDEIVELAEVRHPVRMVIDLFDKTWRNGAQIAREPPDGGNYFAGIVRSIRNGPLHTDVSLRDFADWFIGSFKYQLSWNVYIQVPVGENGVLRVWRREWDSSCESYKRSGNILGYGHDVVKGCSYWDYRPSVSQLVIFKPHHFHEILVNEAAENRLSVSSFMGLADLDSPWFFWS